MFCFHLTIFFKSDFEKAKLAVPIEEGLLLNDCIIRVLKQKQNLIKIYKKLINYLFIIHLHEIII